MIVLGIRRKISAECFICPELDLYMEFTGTKNFAKHITNGEYGKAAGDLALLEVLYSTGSAFVPAGGTTVFFGPGCNLPLNIGKGDRLMIDYEEFFILSRDSETQVSVQSQAKEEHIEAAFTIERAHHSILPTFTR